MSERKEILAPWAYDAKRIVKSLAVDSKTGLDSATVERNRQKFGKNEIPPPPGSSFLALVIEQFQDTLVLILLGAAIVSFVLALFEEGEERVTAFFEPAVILVILFCNATVGVIQETNAEKAIEALKESEARNANVLRNGTVRQVPAADVVVGDIVIVDTGEKVPADARLLEFYSAALTVDEAMLTGESEPPNKHLDPIDKPDAVNQDKRNIVFSGTLLVRGKAKAVVTSVGVETEMGKIAIKLGEKKEGKTPLQEKLDHFGEQLSKVIGIICVVVWGINIGHFTDPDHGSWAKGAVYYFKIAVALAVAAIPEGLPAVVTTCLALGTRKMAKKNAIVRSLPSVETLGCTTVICSDKTGTLTTNQMCVQKVLTIDQVGKNKLTTKIFDVEGINFAPVGSVRRDDSKLLKNPAVEEPALAQISKICSLCNESTLNYDGKTDKYAKTGAPTEAALLVLAEKLGVPDSKRQKETLAMPNGDERARATYDYWRQQYAVEHTLEFDRFRKSMSCSARDQDALWLFVKGAPEAVLQRCTHIQDQAGENHELTSSMIHELEGKIEQFARNGLRCLGLALRKDPEIVEEKLKNYENYSEIESGLTFVGLACMLDPPREEVSASIAKCRGAGIRVIVITGDNKVTAESICTKIGVFSQGEDLRGRSFIGSEFERMPESERERAVQTANLFSRVEPKHKLEIVKLLKKQGEVVAMTGDGVNDATALRQADIGVAMGSGTDVAREASSMVLQDDNFATIVMAVEEGRAIYANTKQFIRYLISSNIGEVACIFLTSALGVPEALIPVQLLWVNLVTDGLPATALGFNPPDKDVMEKPPRGRDEEIINGWMFFRYLVIGVYVGFATVFGSIWWFLWSPEGPHVTFNQLTNFHECKTTPAAFQLTPPFNCDVFYDPRPSTVSLSVLVTIEMFNALNALSENQSLTVVTPASNPWVSLAALLSFTLHFLIIYVPLFANIFHVAPLGFEAWYQVLVISFPVFILDEILKFFSRKSSARLERQKKTH